MAKSDCVYFIGDGGFVKIGFTANLEKRLKQLQTGHRTPLYVLATIPGGTRNTERLLHEELKQHRGNGEWFKCQNEALQLLAAARAGKPLLTKTDIAYAAALPAGAFPIGVLPGKIPKPAKVPRPTKDLVQIKRGVPAPVPEIFVGTPIELRIHELNALRRDKSLTQHELGRVYCELRNLVNGRLLTAA